MRLKSSASDPAAVDANNDEDVDVDSDEHESLRSKLKMERMGCESRNGKQSWRIDSNAKKLITISIHLILMKRRVEEVERERRQTLSPRMLQI